MSDHTPGPFDMKGKVTSDNMAGVLGNLKDIQENSIGNSTSRTRIVDVALATEKPRARGPVLSSQQFNQKDLEGRMAGVIRSFTDPKTGELDEGRMAGLPKNVREGLQTAAVTADTIGSAITSAGYSATGANAHRNQVFLNMAMDNPHVARLAAEQVAENAASPRMRTLALAEADRQSVKVAALESPAPAEGRAIAMGPIGP